MSGKDEADNVIQSGRACGACTLCCKLLDIQETASPHGEWCRECDIGVGCRVYEERPAECRHFNCGYLAWSRAGEHWYPAHSKMIIVLDNDGSRLTIHVDAERPNGWRAQPFYGDIKEWARLATLEKKQVNVCVEGRIIVILPDEDVDLGPVASDERVVTGVVMENGRRRNVAMKVRADDPRLQGQIAGRT